ncbi:MAG: PH domain-containing protein [Candidatus Moranbacteria bacterium]|nr:PH domain-containing protein [Candidatus Moranbacteria bacterium]
MDRFSKYHFKDLNEGEAIVKVVHRNWFYLLEQFFAVFVIAGAYLAGIFYLPLMFPEVVGGQYQKLVAFVENFFVLALWIYSFLIWVDYYFDIWIITTERIVNIEQKGMFTRTVSELRFSRIQDITTEVIGFLPTVINFGDVKVQTAAEEGEFIFRTVSDPYHIKNIIMELQKKAETAKAQDLGELIKEKMEG